MGRPGLRSHRCRFDHLGGTVPSRRRSVVLAGGFRRGQHLDADRQRRRYRERGQLFHHHRSGAFIGIYGQNFGGGATTSTTPFPDSLASTQVFLAGEPLPLYFTSSQQIDAIVPYDIAPNSTQQVVVQSGNALSQPANVIVSAAQPGVFTQDQSGSGQRAILGQKPGGVPTLNSASSFRPLPATRY